MHKINSTVITLGLAGIVALAIGFYVNNVNWGPVGEEKTQAGTQEASTSSTTAAAKPAAKTGDTWAASATGRVEPKSGEVRISADVPGRIDKVPVDINDRVKAGDLLVRLDDAMARAKVKGATAQAPSLLVLDPHGRLGRGCSS